ncbi:MAG: type III secretion system chaperone [Rhodobacteraceae bacterium]|nr:type III secretion system chaperone [Paracoccaceae bacterium]
MATDCELTTEEARELVDGWLADLPSRGEERFKLNEDGICSFDFGENRVVALEVPEGTPVVLVYGVVGDLPDDEMTRLRLYEQAMIRNTFQIATGGGALSALPEQGLLALCYLEPVERADAQHLADMLDLCQHYLGELRRDLLPTDQDGADDMPAMDRSAIIQG